MRREEIETFIAVADTGTIAAAAERLFVSQSTASARIRSLEHDMGCALLERHRGVRKTRLTPAGERFMPLARSLVDLIDDAGHVGTTPPRSRLVVAAADSLNSALLVPFYRAFIARHPDVTLELRTMFSPEINQAVEEHRATLGLAFAIDRYPSLASHALFSDMWRVVCDQRSRFAHTGDPADLPGASEVLTHYSAEFQTWHRHYFARFTHPKIVVGNAAQLGEFLDDVDSWCLAPLSTARRFLEENRNLITCPPPEEPPARVAHLIVRKAERPEVCTLIDRFEAELRAYLAEIGMTTL